MPKYNSNPNHTPMITGLFKISTNYYHEITFHAAQERLWRCLGEANVRFSAEVMVIMKIEVNLDIMVICILLMYTQGNCSQCNLRIFGL